MSSPRSWPSVLSLCALLSLAITSTTGVEHHPASFENTAIVRSIDLGGSTSQVTTTYQVRSLQDGSNEYYFTLSDNDAARTSWMEAKVKGSSAPLVLKQARVE